MCQVFIKYFDIVFSKWAPLLIGGFLVAWFTPIFQSHYAQQAAYQQQRNQLLENIVKGFAEFRFYQGKIVDMAHYQAKYNIIQDIDLDPVLRKRKDEYREKRDQYAVQLQVNLNVAAIFFKGQTAIDINKFLKWSDEIHLNTISKLPNDTIYQNWANLIIIDIEKQLH